MADGHGSPYWVGRLLTSYYFLVQCIFRFSRATRIDVFLYQKFVGKLPFCPGWTDEFEPSPVATASPEIRWLVVGLSFRSSVTDLPDWRVESMSFFI